MYFNGYFHQKWVVSDIVTNDRAEKDTETLFADRRRRYALYCLFRFATPMTLPTLADRVTELEYDAPAESLLDERLRVYMSLYHDHIPLLAEADVVKYSQEDDTVDLAENASAIRPKVIRRATRELGKQWPQSLTD